MARRGQQEVSTHTHTNPNANIENPCFHLHLYVSSEGDEVGVGNYDGNKMVRVTTWWQ